MGDNLVPRLPVGNEMWSRSRHAEDAARHTIFFRVTDSKGRQSSEGSGVAGGGVF